MNTRQLPLFVPQSKLEQAFWQFHLDNPRIYDLLVTFARRYREQHGADAVIGVDLLFERVRWELAIETADALGFKLNNNHRAFYARLIMDNNEDLRDVFRLRKQRIQATIGPVNETLPDGSHQH